MGRVWWVQSRLWSREVYRGCWCLELPSSKAFVLIFFFFDLFDELRRDVTYVAVWRERTDWGEDLG